MRQGHPPAEAAKISLERIIQYYPKFEGAVGKKQNKKCGICIHTQQIIFTIYNIKMLSQYNYMYAIFFSRHEQRWNDW